MPVQKVGHEEPDKKKQTFWLQCLLLFVTAFALYANSIHNGFSMDDEFYTTPANHISSQGTAAIHEVFTTHTLHDNDNSYEYRPVAMLTFLLQHQLLNDNATTSHFINVLLYAVTCVLVFLLLCRWLPGTDNWFSFSVCLLFILHPLHTEVVDSIKSRDEQLALFFTISSLLAAWKAFKTKKVLYWVLYPMLFFLALLSKITVIPYLLVLPLSLYFFGGASVKKSLYYALPMIAGVAIYVCIQYMLPPTIRIFTREENPLLLPGVTSGTLTATSAYVLGWYLLLHFWPHPLVFFYGYDYVPLVSWDNIWAIVSLVLYVAITAYGIVNLKKRSIAAFAALYYIIIIYPFSNLTAPVPGLIGERYTYSSSLAFCMIVCFVLSRLFKIDITTFKKSGQLRYFVAAIGVIGLIYAGATLARNTQWENKETLYTHDIQYLHRSAKANMLYGDLMLLDGLHYRKLAGTDPSYTDSARYCISEAKSALERVIAIVPDYSKAYNNLGIACFKLDSFDKAKKYFLIAAHLAPTNREAIYNLGRTYIRLGQTDSGLAQYGVLLSKDSSYAAPYKDIAETLMRNKDTAAAMNVLATEIRKAPNEQYGYTTLATILISHGEFAQGAALCEKAAELPPPNINVLNFLKKYYTAMNNAEKVQYYQQKIDKYNLQNGQ